MPSIQRLKISGMPACVFAASLWTGVHDVLEGHPFLLWFLVHGVAVRMQ